jgi:hypothetical protein
VSLLAEPIEPDLMEVARVGTTVLVRLVYEAHEFLFGELPDAPADTAMVVTTRGSLLTPASDPSIGAHRGLPGVIAVRAAPSFRRLEFYATIVRTVQSARRCGHPILMPYRF